MNSIFISLCRLDTEDLDFINTEHKNSVNTFTSFFELKKLGIKNILRTFFSYRKYNRVVMVFNDENSILMKDICFILSLALFKVTIYELLPNKQIRKVSNFRRISSIFRVILSAIETRKLLRKALKLTKTSTSSNTKCTSFANLDLLYFKTNLSFGTKAGGSIGHISGVVNAIARKTNVTYISAETPIMIDAKIKRKYVCIDNVVYSIPFELNALKVNNVFIKQIDQLIIQKKPSVIYQRLTLFNYTGAYFSNKYKIHFIVEYNGSEAWVQNNWGAHRLKYSTLALDIEKYVLKSADTIITVSKVLKDELIERGIPREKIVFYPNCIDPNVFDHKLYSDVEKLEFRKQLGYKKEDKIYTFIGTFAAWHGVEFLANSIVNLVRSNKNELDLYNVKFLLIGDGILGEAVRSVLGTEDIKNYVKFTGVIPQNKAPKYLSIADCFLSPHIKQKGKFIGSPTKLFEYMSFAKPIIASDLDQVSSIFEKKLYTKTISSFVNVTSESAIIFEPDNFEEFEKAILFVAKKYEALEKLGENSYDMVMKQYTWEQHVDNIIEKCHENSE